MRRQDRPSGQALVEFALIAPLFFLLLFSLIEFGRAVYTIQMLNNAAREGARYAIVSGAESQCPSGPMPLGQVNPCDPDGSNVVAITKDFAVAIIDAVANDFDVTVQWCAEDGDIGDCGMGFGDGDNGRNQTVKVAVAYTFQPMLAGFVPLPTFRLTGGSSLVVNH